MTTTHYTGEERRKRIFAIVGASSGNLVEWFDFYVYAFCAIYFAPAFFPSDDPTVQLLNTAGVFAAGFLMRPIGGWLFGRVADKHGRKNSMMISVLMMCAGSLVIACLPTYASIGAWAPFLLLMARLFQGLSVGGEYGTTATYMSEVALRGQRGFFASFQYVTLIGGQLLAVLTVVILQQFLSADELRAYGWRIPFVVGAVAAVISLVLRRSLKETTTAEVRENKDAGSMSALFRDHKAAFITVLGYTAGRLADFLHVHHLHAEIPGEHRAHGRQGRELHHDRRTVPVYVHAAAVRHARRQDRPTSFDALVRRARHAVAPCRFC